MKKFVIASFMLLMLVACQPQSSPTAAVGGVKKQQVSGFFTSSGSLPVGWVMIENQGFYCRFFEYIGRGSYADKFNAALAQISSAGEEQGANAFLNLRVTSSSYEIQGSKWHSSLVHICGDFAVIK